MATLRVKKNFDVLLPGRVSALGQQLVQVLRVVVPEDVLGHAAVADALEFEKKSQRELR